MPRCSRRPRRRAVRGRWWRTCWGPWPCAASVCSSASPAGRTSSSVVCDWQGGAPPPTPSASSRSSSGRSGSWSGSPSPSRRSCCRTRARCWGCSSWRSEPSSECSCATTCWAWRSPGAPPAWPASSRPSRTSSLSPSLRGRARSRPWNGWPAPPPAPCPTSSPPPSPTSAPARASPRPWHPSGRAPRWSPSAASARASRSRSSAARRWPRCCAHRRRTPGRTRSAT